jgi:hypothetical protein
MTPRDEVKTPRGEEALPDGWKQYWSKTRQCYYYRNKASGHSSWVVPTHEIRSLSSSGVGGLPSTSLVSRDSSLSVSAFSPRVFSTDNTPRGTFTPSVTRVKEVAATGAGGGGQVMYSRREGSSVERSSGVSVGVGVGPGGSREATALPQTFYAKLDMRGVDGGRCV